MSSEERSLVRLSDTTGRVATIGGTILLVIGLALLGYAGMVYRGDPAAQASTVTAVEKRAPDGR